jgi:predicted nuclease with TOPRIM domain
MYMELLELVERFGTPLITGIVGYLVGRPKQKAEVEATNVENAGKVIDKWVSYADRLEKNVEQLRAAIAELNEALEMVNEEKAACAKTLAKLQIEYDNLKKLYDEVQLELRRIKNEKNNRIGQYGITGE